MDGEEISENIYLELQQRLTSTMEWLFGYEEDPTRQKRFMNAMEVDYKAAASSAQMAEIISLYEMAYRAGYEGAVGATGKKSEGTRRQQR